ncbi:MAG: hypothetical protein CMH98_05430 [Oceanospirillaceae bacterium]|nr:hypothetical protein [Oceanospirillaceae bacterium]
MSKHTEQQKQELALLAGLSDDNIDVSDIPEQTDWSDAQRGKFYRPVQSHVGELTVFSDATGIKTR